jgi:16S rRNA (cytosine1402-N4)-methyltransferase
MSNMPHIPVMLNEVIEHLSPRDNEIYIDCTFGAGGYSKKILASSRCKLYSIDQDPNVIGFVKELSEEYSSERFKFVNNNFGQIPEIAAEFNIKDADGVVFDLGISSMQVDQAERGFSFNKEARLDMRMSGQGKDAWEVVNKYSEEDLADIIYYYGEEHFSRRIASNIVKSRKIAPIDTTLQLAQIVKSSVKRQGKTDPATKTFQAIRVYVNDELKVLKKALIGAYNLLKLDGKLVIVSFQGLEDRIIKDFAQKVPNSRVKSYKPSKEEIKLNPRSRSAKLRVIVKKDPSTLLTEGAL